MSLQVRERDVTLLQTGGWAAIERLLSAIGPIPGVIREQGGTDADLAAIIAELRRRWSVYETPEGIALPGQIVLIEARAPGTEG